MQKEEVRLSYKNRNWWSAKKIEKPLYFHTKGLKKISIHHTAIINNTQNNNVKKRIRSYQKFHLEKKILMIYPIII